MNSKGFRFLLLLVGVCSFALVLSHNVHAAQEKDFFLQVSPSPLVTTVKPDEKKTVEFKIKNNGSQVEILKIQPRKFTFNSQSGRVEVNDKETPDVAPWISITNATPTIKPGDTSTHTLSIHLPKESGFSYAFSLWITREKEEQAPTGRTIQGSLALFTLINVDRPGAKREIEIAEFSASQKVYEFLPAKFTTKVTNTGNTIVQPYGNIYINGGLFNEKTAHETLKVNENSAYILPDTTRPLYSQWSKGFPFYESTQDASGSEIQNLAGNWADINTFRFGKYTATLVAVYNDGERDIPITKKVEFWVIPWRFILVILSVVGLFIYLQIWIIRRRTKRAIKKALARDRTSS